MTEIYKKFKEIHEQIVGLKNDVLVSDELSIELFGISEQLIFGAEKVKAKLMERMNVMEAERKFRMENTLLQAKVKAAKEEKASLFYNAISIRYGQSRQKKNVFARASAYLLMRRYGHTFTSISETFKKGDHSTIISAINTAEDLMWTKDYDFMKIFNEIKEIFDKIYISEDKSDDELTPAYIDKL